MTLPPMRRRLARLLASALVLSTAAVTMAVTAVAVVPRTPVTGMWGTDGRVRAIVETKDAIYLGGDFTALVGPNGQSVARTNFAALDPTTGAPLALAPKVNRTVYDIAVSPDGSTVYAAGTFTKVDNQSRGRVAAFATSSGALLSYDARADAAVEALVVTADRVYLGGSFTSLGTTSRTRLAATTLSGSVVAGFAPAANDLVHDLALTTDGSRLVAGGLFSTINGSANGRKLVLLDASTGKPTYLADKLPYEVFGVGVTEGQIFAGAGGSGGHAYAIDLATRTVDWMALTDGDVASMTPQNGVLYVGGHFTQYGGEPAGHLAAVSPTDGARIAWDVSVNSNLGVFTTSSYRGNLSVGGDFTKVNSIARSHVARFSEGVDTSAPTVPGTPSAAALSPTTASVTWAASTDDSVEHVVYSVYRDGGASPVGHVTSDSTAKVTFQDSGMTPGTSHSWRVRASDGINTSALSAASNTVTLTDPGYPVLTGLGMYDVDTDGRVDRIVASFSADVTCASPCLSPWTLSRVPSGGTVKSVAVSGGTVTLTLAEGSGGQDTAVGGLTVALASSASGVLDAKGRKARFVATAPADLAGPVPTALAGTNGATDNVMEAGDTFTVTFSEALAPASVQAANVKQYDPLGAGNDALIIVGLTGVPIDLGSDAYVTGDGGTIVFAESTLTLLAGNTAVRSTVVGACTGTACGFTGSPKAAKVKFTPELTLTDLAGNGAVGSRSETVGLY